MQGDAQVITWLQAQLKNELTAINQYFLHYRMYKHWGFDKLAKKEYKESIGEMKHADWLMDRIFVLDGLPNLQDLGKLQVGEDVPEALACDLSSENRAADHQGRHRPLRKRARLCLARPAAKDPGRYRGAHRLPRNPAGPDRQGRNPELSAVADGRRVLSTGLRGGGTGCAPHAKRRACVPVFHLMAQLSVTRRRIAAETEAERSCRSARPTAPRSWRPAIPPAA